MSNVNAPTRSVVVQTTLRVIEKSDERTLVVSDRGCQTAILAHPSSTDLNLLPLLEFIPYSEIDKGGIRVIKLPKKSLLQFNLSGNLPTRTCSEVTYKSVLKKSFSNNISSSLHLAPHPSSTPMAKAFEDQVCQTDLSVSPYILEEDAVASVRREIGAQTSVTFEPTATITDVEPRLKEYLSHSHCFVAIYVQGKFTNLEDYKKQTGQYEPVEEMQEVEYVPEESVADNDSSRTVPQQTEISVSKPEKTEKAEKTKKEEQDAGSLDYRYMTDEEFEENIGKILSRTVKNVTALMNRVVQVYERSHPDAQNIDIAGDDAPKTKAKEAEPSDDSVYFSAEASEIKEAEPKETKEVEVEVIKEMNPEPAEEIKEAERKAPENVESEETKEVNIEEIETEPEGIGKVEPGEVNKVEVELPNEQVVSELAEVKAENELVATVQQMEEITADVRGDVSFENIELEIRRIIERLLQSREALPQIVSSPVGDTPQIRRKTHIECECAHPSEAGAAPPTLTPPTLREEPKRETPEKAEDTERIVVEAVEGKPVRVELIVTQKDDIVLRDSISCPETCAAQATSSDQQEQIIRLSVVLPKGTVSQQRTVPCKTIDNKLIQATQSDTQIYVSQKPSTLPCGCPQTSKDTQPPVISSVTPVCTKVGEIICGDKILEICGDKMEDECVPCTDEVDECMPCTEVVDKCVPFTEEDECMPCTEVVDKCVPCTEEIEECVPCTEVVDKCLACTEVADKCVPCTEEVDECVPCIDKFIKPSEELCICLSMQSYEQCRPVSVVEKKRKNEATFAQLCECSKPLVDDTPEFCCCFELPFSDDEDDSLQGQICGKICPVHFSQPKRQEKICTCGEPIEIIYPEKSVCSCCSCNVVYSISSVCVCGREETVSETCICYDEYPVESVSEICSYCRSLQEAAEICVCGDGSDIRTYDFPEEKPSGICLCEASHGICLCEASQETMSKILSETRSSQKSHPEGQDLSLKVSGEEKEIAVQEYGDIRQESCSNVCEKSVEAQTTFAKESICLIYQQSRNIVEPYMDKLRNIKTEAPQEREPSLLYLTDRRSIEQYMKTLDPEDARDMMIPRIPIPEKSSIKDVDTESKQMTLVAVEISTTQVEADAPDSEDNESLTTNVTVRAAAWKVGDEFHTAFDSSFGKDTLTYVTNEEEVEVVDPDSKSTPIASTCSTAVGSDVGGTYSPSRLINSENKKEKTAVKERDSVKFLFMSSTEKQVVTPTQSQPTLETKPTPDPPTTQITPTQPEILSNLDTVKMPCECQKGKNLTSSEPSPNFEPSPNLTCLFEDDSEYHEGYMEEMTDESVSVQTQLKFLGGKIPLVECAGSLPDVVNETNRCDSKMEMPWLRISLPPVGFYQIEKMEGRPKKKTCDCWKLDTRDSVFLAEPVVRKVICPTRTPDEYKTLNLDGGDENITGESDDAEDDTLGQAALTDRTEAEGTLEDDQPPSIKEAEADQPKEEGQSKEEGLPKEEESDQPKGEEEVESDQPKEEGGANEDQSRKEEGISEDQSHTEEGEEQEEAVEGEDQPEKEGVGEDRPPEAKIDKKICVCLPAIDEDDCVEFKKPMQFVYDNLCYEANEAYMEPLYKLYPDDCDTVCGSRTEIPWEDIILPTMVKLRGTKKKRKQIDFEPLYENAAAKGVTETPSRAKSDRSAISEKSIQSQKSEKTDFTKLRKQRSGMANSAVEIELSFAEVVSNMFNIEGGAATQATVSQISVISDIRMTPKRCAKDYIITVRTADGTEQRVVGGGVMQTIGSQPFEFKVSQMTGAEINPEIVGSKIPEKTKSHDITDVNYDESSVAEATERKAKSMPDVPSKTSKFDEAYAKFLALKSSKQDAKDGTTASGSYKPVRVRISKESTGVASFKGADNVMVMVRSTSSKESKGSRRSTRAQDSTFEGRETRTPIKSTGSKESRRSGKSLETALGVSEVMPSKESRGTCRSLRSKEPSLDAKEPIRSVSSRESRGTKGEVKKPCSPCNISASKDPIKEALNTYQQEMKPLRESLERLKAKIRDLNLPELSSWASGPQRGGPAPCTSIYGRRGVGYPPGMTGAPYGMPSPNMQMGFGMRQPIPPSYYPPSQFNFMPPRNMYHPQLQPSPLRTVPPQQFQSYPESRTGICKGKRSKSRMRRKHRRKISSKSSSEMSTDCSASGEKTKCPFLGTTSAVSCASLPKSSSTKVKKRSSKAVCTCRKRRQRQAKTEAKNQHNQTNMERIEKATRTEPEVKIHLPPRDSKVRRSSRCKAVQHVANKAPPPYIKSNNLRVAVRIAPRGGGFPDTGEDSCSCKD